ncbi:MAG: hypothetical protein Q4D26_01490 [Clostridia bacterium]|nr:hypothetical protein [Clostridia bacterium]
MRSDFKEIKDVYCKLEEKGVFPWNKNKEESEREYYEYLDELYENKQINDSSYSDLKEMFAAGMLPEELKGFASGIYLILKLKSEMGVDFDNMVKMYKS